MGNRVVIQFVSGVGNSPAIYGHWSGREAAGMLTKLREQMSDRPSDIAYIAARAVARLIVDADAVDDSTGFGIWNAPAQLTADDSHGDAGIYLVNVSQSVWQVSVFGGRVTEQGEVRSTANVKFRRT